MRLVLSRNVVFISVHVFCWFILAIGILYDHPTGLGIIVTNDFWIRQTMLLVILMFVFYLNFYLLIPRLLIPGKVLIYIIVVVTIIAVITFLNNFIATVFNLNPFVFSHPVNHPHPPHAEPPGRPDRRGHFDTFVPGMNLLMVGLGIAIGFIQKWQQEVVLREKLEQEKTATELSFLKAQINPHFFFNTLNTIYSYTLSDGDVARAAITNLSKMMRYVLYDAVDRQTPLSKEIAFIKEYTELMKLRISKKTTVLLQLKEGPADVMIAPMLFLPFIENAFKHGVSSIDEGHITIWVLQNERNIELIVKNTVYERPRANEEASNGIGILNTTRRLELLYPGKYMLTTGMVNQAEYEAKLKLYL